MFRCRFCEREFTTLSGKTFHENRCVSNPNHIIHPGNKGWNGKGLGMNGWVAWNKGHTKETDPRIATQVETLKKHIAEGKVIPHHTKHSKRTKEILSLIQQERIKDNPDLIKSCGRAKKYSYQGETLDGLWELNFAKFLDANDIRWERPKIGIAYLFEERTHYYFPDFYLPTFHTYVEVKGFERDIDRLKWESVKSKGMNIVIIRQSQIESIKRGSFDIVEYINKHSYSSMD